MKSPYKVNELFQKKMYPPCRFFEVDLPGFPVKFTLVNFFGLPPLEFQRLLLYPLQFSIVILNSGGGVTIFFLEKPNKCLRHIANYLSKSARI